MSPPAAAAAPAARARHAEAAPLRLPPAPRRVSGPRRHPRAVAARPAASPSLVIRVIDHPWLERLVRGRAWIAIVATALLGIVAMQVALLRLGAQIGSETTAVNALTAQNETTRTENAVLEASHRLSATARDLGMVYPAPGAVSYLAVNTGDAARAVHEMTAPSSIALAAAASDAHFLATTASNPPPRPASTPAGTPATTPPATSTPSTTTAATTTPGAPTTGATTTVAATTPAGTTSLAATGTAAAGAGTTTATTPATTATGTTATTTPVGTTTTPVSGTPASTTGGAATAPVTTAAGGTTPGP